MSSQMISNAFSNILRGEGKPNLAMTGNVLGNLVNVILDPILILGFDWGIKGAAIATVIGNAVGGIYYLAYYALGKSALSVHPKYFCVKDGVAKDVLSIGIPACLLQLLMSFSQIFSNSLIASYGSLQVAAFGVTNKVSMIVATIGSGIGQGIIFFPAAWGLEKVLGASGVALAQPVADVLSTILVIVLVIVVLKKLKAADADYILWEREDCLEEKDK